MDHSNIFQELYAEEFANIREACDDSEFELRRMIGQGTSQTLIIQILQQLLKKYESSLRESMELINSEPASKSSKASGSSSSALKKNSSVDVTSINEINSDVDYLKSDINKKNVSSSKKIQKGKKSRKKKKHVPNMARFRK